MDFETTNNANCHDLRCAFDPDAGLGYTRAMERTHDIFTETTATAPPVPDGDAHYRALVARMADADEAALTLLYDAVAGRVYALALRITRSARDAEEIVLDVFHQAWRQAHQYDAARGRVLGWIMTICRSRALDALRRRDAAQPHPTPGDLLDAVADSDHDPRRWVEMFERDGAVRRALEDLPAAQRELVGLAFLRGLSHQEIADETGLPLGTVKSHIRKALVALQNVLPNPFDVEAP